jgi:hypothetical protein
VALACCAAAAQPSFADGWRLAGEGRLRHWGLAVYDARLWVETGFVPARFDRHAFALELAYLRSLRGADIADVSVAEMQRLRPLAEAEAARRLSRLRALFPDVREGDRIVGVHRPGQGAEFLLNGSRRLGRIDEPAFAADFFAIWLSPATSQPALRVNLLQGVQP